jgi:hypothetical protein
MADLKEWHIFVPFGFLTPGDGFLTPGDGTDRLSQHVKKLPLLAA